MLIKLSTHWLWIAGTSLLTAGAAAWYGTEVVPGRALPGGGSVPGLTFGIAGGVIILFELALWLRKRWRRWRLGKTSTWMRAHIWGGLLTVPLLLLHSGFVLGGWLSTSLAFLFPHPPRTWRRPKRRYTRQCSPCAALLPRLSCLCRACLLPCLPRLPLRPPLPVRVDRLAWEEALGVVYADLAADRWHEHARHQPW